MSLFDDQTIGIPCPGCGHETEKTVAWLKANNQFTCVCGSTITLESDQFREGISQAEGSLDELERAFKNFGK